MTRSAGLPFPVDVAVSEPGWAEVAPDADAFVAQAVGAALSVLDASPTGGLSGELSVALVSDAEIADLNARFRSKDGPTNVLSFPSSQPDIVQGDIVVALQTVLRECHRSGRSPHDHALHLLVHGFLHLHGYDHMKARDAEVMEALERSALETLGLPDPYIVKT